MSADIPEHGAPPAAPPEPEQPPQSYELIGRRTESQQRSTVAVASGLLLLALGYFGWNAEVRDPLHLYLGLLIILLSALPAILWLRQGGSRFPVFEPIMLLCASAYGLPLLTGHQYTTYYPPETLTKAAIAVIAYQLASIAVYSLAGGRPGRGRFWTESVISRDVERIVSYGLVLSTLYMGVSSFTDWIPAELGSVLRAVFFGLSILCTFIASQRWGRGELSQHERWIFGAMVLVQMVFICTSLILIAALCQLGIALLGYLSSGRRVPWAVMSGFFAVFAVLHNGKAVMREIYWEDNIRQRPEISALPAFYAEWFEHGLSTPLVSSGGQASASSRLLERTSLFHLLCLVVHHSPEYQPYLNGETYGYVLPQLIPRFFWPDKPPSHISTYRLSIYYGLQTEEGTETTTIAFGMVTEAYANFGWLGCLLLGLVFGAFLKKMQVWSAHSPLFSLAGLTMIILTAWSFNSEMTMAVWFSSLYQALIIVLGLPLLLRSLIGL